MKPRLFYLSMAGLIGCLFATGSLLAENPSPAPTPSIDARVSDLELRIQAIEKATLLIQGVAFDDNSTWIAGKQQ